MRTLPSNVIASEAKQSRFTCACASGGDCFRRHRSRVYPRSAINSAQVGQARLAWRLAMTWRESAAVVRPLGLLGVGSGRRRRRVRQPVLDLRLDLLELVVLGLEILGVRPLELGLERPADPPVCVAEVVVDGRIDRLELDRALELLDRLVVLAEP